jgi:hypothetical protein
MAPAVSGIAGGRAHPVAMPSLAKHARARRLSDRLIARQAPRARRDDMLQQEREQQASQCPGGPPALGKDPVIGSHRPRRLLTRGPQHVGDGPAACRQHGGKHQDQHSRRRWGRKRRPKHGQYWYSPDGEMHD